MYIITHYDKDNEQETNLNLWNTSNLEPVQLTEEFTNTLKAVSEDEKINLEKKEATEKEIDDLKSKIKKKENFNKRYEKTIS